MFWTFSVRVHPQPLKKNWVRGVLSIIPRPSVFYYYQMVSNESQLIIITPFWWLKSFHIPYKRNAILYKRHFLYVIDRFDSVPLCLSHISGFSYKRNVLYYCFRIILLSLSTKLRKLLSNWIFFEGWNISFSFTRVSGNYTTLGIDNTILSISDFLKIFQEKKFLQYSLYTLKTKRLSLTENSWFNINCL